jgi:hypothetical protein
MAAFVVWPWWVSSCRGHDGCVTPYGVAVVVVALHGGIVVAVVAPCVVLRSRPSCYVVLWLWRVLLHCMVSSHHHYGW